MASVRRTEEAEQDLEAILDYLDNHSPSAAERFIRTFKEKTETLAQMPEIGRSREELFPGLRSFTVGNYLIFYRPIAEGIEVIRVAHGSRDLPSLFN